MTIFQPAKYYVSSVDKSGNEDKSNVIFTEVYDLFPPSQPVGLVAKADTGKIMLTWQMNNEEDLMGYRIYRTVNKDDENNYVLLNSGPIKGNSFTDKLPKNAKNRFLYKLVAIDSAYNVSSSTETVSVQMPDIIPPVRPLITNIVNDGNSIKISWLPNKDLDLMGYHIYRKVSGEDFVRINAAVIQLSQSTFNDQQIESGKAYFYYLAAVDSVKNESLPSDIQKGLNNFNSLNSIPYDINLKYRKDKNDIHISWKAEKSKELLGYVIFRSQGDAVNMSALSGKLENHEYSDKDIKPGRIYFYEIKAFDSKGNIARSEVKKISIK